MLTWIYTEYAVNINADKCLRRKKNMKKSFLFIIAVILIVAYMKYISTSVPVALEKKVIEDGHFSAMADIMPEIRVMTYNIHRGINKNSELDLDGMAEVIKNSEAEIIALQEVERFSVRTRFQDQIKYIADKLSMQYAFGKSINILNGQYGNAILSKYPIEEYEVSELPSEGEQRTLLKAGLNVQGNRISIYNTHLGLKQSERNMQIEEIMRISQGEKIFIIAGDFNTSMDKLPIITTKLIDCGNFQDNAGKATFEEDGLSERIDYIFVSKNFEVKDYQVIKADASDHYPVVSVLKITN